MGELNTTYTIKGKQNPIYWEFKYDLNGHLKEFKLLEGSQLTDKLVQWVFHPARFPYKENMIESWKAIKNLEVIIGKPDLTFDSFWTMYGLKAGRVAAESAFKRLTKSEKLKAFKAIKPYNGYLRRTGISKAYAQKYLNQKKFNDEFNSLH